MDSIRSVLVSHERAAAAPNMADSNNVRSERRAARIVARMVLLVATFMAVASYSDFSSDSSIVAALSTIGRRLRHLGGPLEVNTGTNAPVVVEWSSVDSNFESSDQTIANVSLLALNENTTNTTNMIANDNTTHTMNADADGDNVKPLIPLDGRDIASFVLAALGLILAAGGGIGGGGILVPIYILVLGFLPKHAIPLSNVTVFGGAAANTILNVRKRHPHADRPLVDWDLILVMEPATLAGALIGANLNKVLSETIIAVMLVMLLSSTAFMTLKKAKKMHKKESIEMRGMRAEYSYSNVHRDTEGEGEGEGGEVQTAVGVDGPPDMMVEEEAPTIKPIMSLPHCMDTMLGNDRLVNYDELNRSGSSAQPIPPELEPENPQESENPQDSESTSNVNENIRVLQREKLIKQERHPGLFNVLLIILLFTVVLTVNLLKGGGAAFPSPLGIKCGSVAFWSAQVLLLLWTFGISFVARRYLLQRAAQKDSAGYLYLPDDIRWTPRSTVVYPLASAVAGLAAGMFGIGGGIVKGPLMIAMGVHPAVASATSACMILFTSATATTTFVVFGLLVVDYGAVCVVLGFISTLVGQTIMTLLLKKFKRNSFIAYSIGIVVLLSAILMTLQSVLHFVADEKDEEFIGICADNDF